MSTMSSPDPADDLERIRQAREGDDSSDGLDVEVFICPVQGCSRTIIGDSANLRHHVRQESDDDHAGFELTEDLELVKRWEQMEWGPGALESEVIE
ncbi:hypothetical protein [Natrialba aegyptia]|uniref:C2H2-type domain-containing protein n=1 Tax=Natrialba aegyptia DSM 13077 TaxID=1227491 RepID=M0B914_9EURY|nr:hypothetical protein [Natrialba aegyptia]ELZ06793.1 hypothetical protein C480_07167 [Natrialba aegyptia DSM 13077]